LNDSWVRRVTFNSDLLCTTVTCRDLKKEISFVFGNARTLPLI